MMDILSQIGEEKGHPFSGGWDIYGKEFGYEVHRSYCDAVNVIIWNPEHNKNADLSIRNVSTGDLGNKFHAWSFWDEKYLGVIDKSYVAKGRSEEHTSELQSLMRISYAVFCLKKKKKKNYNTYAIIKYEKYKQKQR